MFLCFQELLRSKEQGIFYKPLELALLSCIFYTTLLSGSLIATCDEVVGHQRRAELRPGTVRAFLDPSSQKRRSVDPCLPLTRMCASLESASTLD